MFTNQSINRIQYDRPDVPCCVVLCRCCRVIFQWSVLIDRHIIETFTVYGMMDAARRLNVLSRHVGDHSVRGSSVSALVVGGVVLDIQVPVSEGMHVLKSPQGLVCHLHLSEMQAQPHADQQLLRGGSVPGKVLGCKPIDPVHL